MVQLKELGVGCVEDLRILYADGEQRIDVEEAPEIELFSRHLPVGEPVILLRHTHGQRQVLRACTDGEDVFVVTQDRLFALVLQTGDHPVLQRQLPVSEHGSDALTKEGHEDPVGIVIGTVEPSGIRRVRALLKDRPQRPVVEDGGWDSHVIRHDIDDDAHFALMRGVSETDERVAAAEILAHGRGIDDVVAVGAARGSLEDGAEIDIGDTEGIKIVQRFTGSVETLIGPELNAIGRHRGAFVRQVC